MKTYNIKIKILSLSLLFLVLAGCEKDFLDINEDPNNPTDAPLSQLLPSAQVGISGALSMGGYGLSNVASSWMSQTVQRGDPFDYTLSGNSFTIAVAWETFYADVLTDLRLLIERGSETEDWHYVGVAQILKAYAYSQMVDVWGDIPYEEANLGSELNFPSYQDDQSIYAALFPLLDEGIANLGKTSNLSPGSEDLIYNGDINKWRKFAKSLKLKLYNQVRLTSMYDAGAVSALINGGDLIDENSEFEMQYGSSTAPENRNPGYIQDIPFQQRTYYIHPYFYEILTDQSDLNDILEGVSDPRVPYYFFNQLTDVNEAENPTEYADPSTGFVSIWDGSISTARDYGQASSQTILGLYPVGGPFDHGEGDYGHNAGGYPAAPLRMFTYHDLLYVRGELALMEGAPGNVQEIFEQAVRSSFEEVNEVANAAGVPAIPESDIDSYVSTVAASFEVADNDRKLEHLMTQKWIASFGYSVDIYTDYRRTGYPEVFDANTDNNPLTVHTRRFPVSFPYESEDLNINPNAPNQRNIYTDRIFWDN